jgi:NADH:ubiquinone oxidoreductase subunit 3 (subunit A)
VKLLALVLTCVIVGAALRGHVRDTKRLLATYFICSIVLYIVFDAHRLREYLVPWSIGVSDMILVPIVYEGPPCFLFALLPMTIGGWLGWLIRVKRR